MQILTRVEPVRDPAEKAGAEKAGADKAGLGKPAAGMKSLLDTCAAASVLASLVVLALMLGLRACGMLQPLELMAYDRMVLLCAEQSETVRRVVQIGITEDDLNRFGWPLPDGILADVVLRLHAAGARAIGIDIFRPVPIGSGTPALDRALADVREVVWVDRFSQAGWDGIAAPAAVQTSERNGFGDFLLDPGGVVRRSLLYLNDRRHREQSFSLRLALLYLAHDGIFPRSDAGANLKLGSISLPPIQTPLGGYADLDTRGYQTFLEFRGPTHIESFPLADLLDGKVPDGFLGDRIVVVGVTADSVKDYVATSLSAVSERGIYGVTLQGLSAAQLVSHALDGLAPIHVLPHIWETVLIVLVVMAGGCAGTFLRDFWRLVVAVVGGAVLLLGAAFGCFLHGLWLPVLPLTSGWVIAAVSAVASITYAERAQKAVLMRLFSAHVSGPIAAELWRRRNDFISHGRPIPVRLPATVLFADINGFTTISEMLEPETLVRWLSSFMDAMTSLIERHNGVIDRLAGDCVMALFGPPIVRQHLHEIETDAIEAVRYAVSMSQTLLELNRTYRAEGLPEIRIGIGIHSGELVSCCLGSAKRQQYTTIGDTANTAARLMTVAKEYMKKVGSDDVSCVALSDATRALLGGAFNLHALGPVMCKGKKDPIACYLLHSEGHCKPQSPRNL